MKVCRPLTRYYLLSVCGKSDRHVRLRGAQLFIAQIEPLPSLSFAPDVWMSRAYLYIPWVLRSLVQTVTMLLSRNFRLDDSSTMTGSENGTNQFGFLDSCSKLPTTE